MKTLKKYYWQNNADCLTSRFASGRLIASFQTFSYIWSLMLRFKIYGKIRPNAKRPKRYMQALKNSSFKNQIQMKKNILIISFFLIANSIFAQKVYKVDCVSWIYEKPENYNYQTDNFSEIVNLGESFLNNEKNLNLNPEEDILFSITKEENVNFNIIISSYLSNNNIKTFGLDEYITELINVFKEKYKELGTPINITKEKIQIDGKVFYVIKNIISNPEKNYTTYMYIGEIGNKELQITTVIDNPIDEKLITQSILNSKFK